MAETRWRTERGAVAEKRKRSRFWVWYVSVSLGLLLLVLIALAVAWGALSDYQRSIPVNVMDSVLDAFQKENSDWLLSGIRRGCSEFEDPAKVKSLLQERLQEGQAVSYKRAFSADRIAHPTYTIYAGEQELAKVVLRRQPQQSRFGFSLYEVDAIIPLAKSKGSLSFLLPDNYTAYLNDIAVSEQYRTESGLELEQSDWFCGSSAPSRTAAIYVVEDLLYTPVVKVKNQDGQEVKLRQDPESGELSVLMKERFILAPEGAHVLADGMEISGSEHFVLEKGLQPEGLSEVPLGTYSEQTYVKYRIIGPSVEPELTASVAGLVGVVTASSQPDTYLVSYPVTEEQQEAYTKQAMEFAKLYSLYVTGDSSKSKVLQNMLPGTPMYKRLKDDFYAGYFTSHDSTGFREEKTENLILHHPAYFSCDISYIQWVEGFVGNPNLSRDYPSAFTIHFVYLEKEQKWYVADFQIQSVPSEQPT